jgi:hypothetical protein
VAILDHACNPKTYLHVQLSTASWLPANSIDGALATSIASASRLSVRTYSRTLTPAPTKYSAVLRALSSLRPLALPARSRTWLSNLSGRKANKFSSAVQIDDSIWLNPHQFPSSRREPQLRVRSGVVPQLPAGLGDQTVSISG